MPTYRSLAPLVGGTIKPKAEAIIPKKIFEACWHDLTLLPGKSGQISVSRGTAEFSLLGITLDHKWARIAIHYVLRFFH